MVSELLTLAAAALGRRRYSGPRRRINAEPRSPRCGVVAGILAAIASLPAGSPTIVLPNPIIGEPVSFRVDPEGLWLMGFGLVPAGFACALASPSTRGAPAGCSAPQ